MREEVQMKPFIVSLSTLVGMLAVVFADMSIGDHAPPIMVTLIFVNIGVIGLIALALTRSARRTKRLVKMFHDWNRPELERYLIRLARHAEETEHRYEMLASSSWSDAMPEELSAAINRDGRAAREAQHELDELLAALEASGLGTKKEWSYALRRPLPENPTLPFYV